MSLFRWSSRPSLRQRVEALEKKVMSNEAQLAALEAKLGALKNTIAATGQRVSDKLTALQKQVTDAQASEQPIDLTGPLGEIQADIDTLTALGADPASTETQTETAAQG